MVGTPIKLGHHYRKYTFDSNVVLSHTHLNKAQRSWSWVRTQAAPRLDLVFFTKRTHWARVLHVYLGWICRECLNKAK